MSRKKDIAALAPLKAKLFNLSESEAGRQLHQLSARELRKRRKKVERATHPMTDPAFRQLMSEWEEINKVAGRMLAELPARNLPPHLTVQ